jgi:hypothetical protein
VDLTITERADGTEIKVNPGLELLLDHDLRALAASLPNLKGAALKAISHAKLSGADAAILIGNYPKVESGTLDLDATGMLDGQPDVHLAVAAGQCLVDATTAPPADSHPFAAWVSGTCQP